MLDITTEQPISLADAARLIPPGRGGKQTYHTTLMGWIRRGAKAPGGGLEHHDGTDRVGHRDTRQEAPDVVIVPDPAALEVGSWVLPSRMSRKRSWR